MPGGLPMAWQATGVPGQMHLQFPQTPGGAQAWGYNSAPLESMMMMQYPQQMVLDNEGRPCSVHGYTHSPSRLPMGGSRGPGTAGTLRLMGTRGPVSAAPGGRIRPHTNYSRATRRAPLHTRGGSHKSGGGGDGGNGAGTSEATAEAAAQLGDVHKTMIDITDLMTRLDQVYINRGEIAEKHYNAAAQIQRVARGRLTRLRFARNQAAMGRWRARHAAELVHAYERYTSGIERVKAWTAMSTLSREMKLRSAVLLSWAAYVRRRGPAARERLGVAKLMLQNRHNKLLTRILQNWCTMAHSQHSRKTITGKWRKRFEEARERLQVKQEQWMKTTGGASKARITKESIVAEMHLHAIKVTAGRMNRLSMVVPFKAWVEVTVAPRREANQKARGHYKRVILGKCLKAWGSYYDEHLGGVDIKAPSKERFLQRHNMKMVKAHARALVLGKHLKAWWLYATRVAAAKRKFQGVADALLRNVIAAWRTRARWQRKTKQLCVGQWVEVSQRLLSVPFKAWYVWAHNSVSRQRYCLA